MGGSLADENLPFCWLEPKDYNHGIKGWIKVQENSFFFGLERKHDSCNLLCHVTQFTDGDKMHKTVGGSLADKNLPLCWL